jgi:hypothetical protein
MRRRFLLGAALALAPLAAAAQLGAQLGRPGVSPGGRPGVDAALVRTVTLVLRAEARQGRLPDFMTDPEPLPDDQIALLTEGARLAEDFPAQLVPARVNRRLPHARGGSVWAVAGTWMIEVDPVRLRVLSIAPDVLPPDI